MRQKYLVLYLNLLALMSYAQNFQTYDALEFSVFRGSIIKHAPDIGHLITDHPDGFVLGYTFGNSGDKEWHHAYPRADYGFSLLYQDFKTNIAGTNLALSAHMNFYFLNRRLQFRFAQGIARNSNPYDRETNFRNNAFGQQWMSANTFMLRYLQPLPNVPLTLHAGLVFTHFSNGRFQFPNRGLNTYGVQVGIQYQTKKHEYTVDTARIDKPKLEWNQQVYFRSGLNESTLVGAGKRPFYHISYLWDRQISRKSALQFGLEGFWTESRLAYMRFIRDSYPEDIENLNPRDYRRFALLVGHEWFISRFSVETQLGYYVYKPFKDEINLYKRLGLKYYITPSFFSGIALKTHGGRAEAIEWGLGVRL